MGKRLRTITEEEQYHSVWLQPVEFKKGKYSLVPAPAFPGIIAVRAVTILLHAANSAARFFLSEPENCFKSVFFVADVLDSEEDHAHMQVSLLFTDASTKNSPTCCCGEDTVAVLIVVYKVPILLYPGLLQDDLVNKPESVTAADQQRHLLVCSITCFLRKLCVLGDTVFEILDTEI